MQPKNFPPHNTVFYYFNKWKREGVFEERVGRSSSWLENFRRIAMDYEFHSDTGEAMVQLAFCRLMYNKLCY